VYARGGVVGGGSAGLAIQGEVIFDSAAADRVLPGDRDVATPDAVANPYEPAISFTTDFFHWPPLAGAITDTHFARRDRFGRLAAFMARALRDGLLRGPRAYGVAVDEGAALLVDARGVATLVKRAREDDGYVPLGAYILESARAAQIAPRKPLRTIISVTHIDKPGGRYDLRRKQGSGVRYEVGVNGADPAHPYSRNPYR
jgi:cyanophycinase-like exopeptidase